MRFSQLIEYKSIDSSTTLAANNGGNILLLNGLVKGDNLDQRCGRKIVMTSLAIRLSGNSTTATGACQAHRVLIVQDKAANGTALSITDVLDAITVYSHPNLNNRLRFNILHDFMVAVSAADDPQSWYVREFKMNMKIPVIYNSGNAGTIADIVTNSVYLIVMGTEAAGTTAGSVLARVRIRFADA